MNDPMFEMKKTIVSKAFGIQTLPEGLLYDRLEDIYLEGFKAGRDHYKRSISRST